MPLGDITGFSDPVYDAIKAYFTAQWTATDIQWPNDLFEPTTGQAYVKFIMTGGLYEQVSLGAEIQAQNRWDRDGTLQFYIISPIDNDFTNVQGAALAIAKIFRGKTLLPGLQFGAASINPSDASTEGPWFVLPLTIEWLQLDAA